MGFKGLTEVELASEIDGLQTAEVRRAHSGVS